MRYCFVLVVYLSNYKESLQRFAYDISLRNWFFDGDEGRPALHQSYQKQNAKCLDVENEELMLPFSNCQLHLLVGPKCSPREVEDPCANAVHL